MLTIPAAGEEVPLNHAHTAERQHDDTSRDNKNVYIQSKKRLKTNPSISYMFAVNVGNDLGLNQWRAVPPATLCSTRLPKAP